MTRDKRNQSKIELLASVLESEGILSEREAAAIIEGDNYRGMHDAASGSVGKGRPEFVDRARGRTGPPEGRGNGRGAD